MNRSLSFFCLILAATRLSLIGATTIANPGPVGRPQAGGGPTYLINQNFEGTGYDNSETWTESGTGTKDEDYATSPAPLVGSQSLRIVASAQTPFTNGPTHAATADIWVYCQVNFTTFNGTRTVLRIRNSTTGLCTVESNVTGNLIVNPGGGSSTTTDALATGTTYHIWMHYVKGTGANALGTVGFSTDGVKPTSGTKFASKATGTATLDADNEAIGLLSSGTYEFVLDKFLVDDETIGDSP